MEKIAFAHDDDLEVDCAATWDAGLDRCLKLPGQETQTIGLVSKVMTDPWYEHRVQTDSNRLCGSDGKGIF